MFSFFSRLSLAAAAALAIALAPGALGGIPTAVSDLQTCQQYASYLQNGQIPPNACQPDTTATIQRCLQYGGVSAADQKTIIDSINAYCASQQG